MSNWHFIHVADQRSQVGNFEKVCDAINSLLPDAGDFIVNAGDEDCDGCAPPATPEASRAVIDAKFGTSYRWIPGIGNHEAETPADMTWLRQEWHDPTDNNPAAIREPISSYATGGPEGTTETQFYFVHKGILFVYINEYWDGADDDAVNEYSGQVISETIDWLTGVFLAYESYPKFVIGHAPAFPQNRHLNNCINKYVPERDVFWNLLTEHNVLAYLCGHTHWYSRYQVNNTWDNIANIAGDVWNNGFSPVWQIDAGNAGNDSGVLGISSKVRTLSAIDVPFGAWRSFPRRFL